jgi:hypothetical protein
VCGWVPYVASDPAALRPPRHIQMTRKLQKASAPPTQDRVLELKPPPKSSPSKPATDNGSLGSRPSRKRKHPPSATQSIAPSETGSPKRRQLSATPGAGALPTPDRPSGPQASISTPALTRRPGRTQPPTPAAPGTIDAALASRDSQSRSPSTPGAARDNPSRRPSTPGPSRERLSGLVTARRLRTARVSTNRIRPGTAPLVRGSDEWRAWAHSLSSRVTENLPRQTGEVQSGVAHAHHPNVRYDRYVYNSTARSVPDRLVVTLFVVFSSVPRVACHQRDVVAQARRAPPPVTREDGIGDVAGRAYSRGVLAVRSIDTESDPQVDIDLDEEEGT